MSIGTNNKPEPAKPSWLSIAASIAVAVLGTMQVVRPNPAPAPNPNPPPAPTVIVNEEVVPVVPVTPVTPPVVPVNPPVTPVVQPVTPVTPVIPQPAIVIPPKPVVTPTPIGTGVTITDTRGNPIGNTVDPGVMFWVVANDGVTLTGPEKPGPDADIVEFAQNKLLCTLRHNYLLNIIVSGGGTRASIISVQCNHAPQPPPVVVPVVPPVVDPNPVVPTPPPIVNPVLTGGVRVVILRDAMKALSQPQVSAINSPRVEELLNAKCAKDDAGKPAWHRWEIDVDVSELPAWNKLITATRAKIKSDGLTLPLLIVERGNKLHLYEITDESAMLKTLNDSFSGGAN